MDAKYATQIREIIKRQEFEWAGLPENIKLTGSKEGYVYIAALDSGHIKIGKSRAPWERIKHFNTIMPLPVHTLYWFYCDNCAAAESSLHQRYKKYRTVGEWFDLPYWELERCLEFHCFWEGDFHYTEHHGRDYDLDDTINAMFLRGVIVRTCAELPY